MEGREREKLQLGTTRKHQIQSFTSKAFLDSSLSPSKTRPKARISTLIRSGSLFLIMAPYYTKRPLNLAVSQTMPLGPPLIYACERQRLVFRSFERQVSQHPELLSALSKVTQQVTRKTEIKPKFPDCQTQILSNHSFSFFKTIWFCIPRLCICPIEDKMCIIL